MTSLYFIQLIGVLLTGLGVVALTACYHLYGKPLSREEELRVTGKESGFRRMPFNLETIVSSAFFLVGMWLLTWSKFDTCTFLGYWLPNLPDALMLLLSCR